MNTKSSVSIFSTEPRQEETGRSVSLTFAACGTSSPDSALQNPPCWVQELMDFRLAYGSSLQLQLLNFANSAAQGEAAKSLTLFLLQAAALPRLLQIS